MTWTTVASHISFDVGSWSIQPGAPSQDYGATV